MTLPRGFGLRDNPTLMPQHPDKGKSALLRIGLLNSLVAASAN